MAAQRTYSALLSDGTRVQVEASSGTQAIEKAKELIADRPKLRVRSAICIISV